MNARRRASREIALLDLELGQGLRDGSSPDHLLRDPVPEVALVDVEGHPAQIFGSVASARTFDTE